MTGWHLGRMVAPDDLVAPIERIAQNFTIAAPIIWASTASRCHSSHVRFSFAGSETITPSTQQCAARSVGFGENCTPTTMCVGGLCPPQRATSSAEGLRPVEAGGVRSGCYGRGPFGPPTTWRIRRRA